MIVIIIYIYISTVFSNANSSDFVVGGFLTPHTPKDAGNEGDSRSQSASFRSTSTSSDSGGPSVGGVDPMVGMGLINPIVSKKPPKINMDVSKNSGTPKSSILIGFSIINHPFWGTTIFGNTQIEPEVMMVWKMILLFQE